MSPAPLRSASVLRDENPKWVAFAFCIVAAVASCSSTHGSSSAPTDAGGVAAGRYALLTDGAWKLQEAVDFAANDPNASVEKPAVDWYDEYVRSTRTSSQMVRVSGHLADFNQSRAEIEKLGIALHEVTINGWRAVGGLISDVSPPGALLVLDHGSSAIEMLSYELSLDELSALASRIKLADSATWIRAGGIVR